MLPPDHPLARLQSAAALLSGWPALHVLAPDEAGVAAARRVAESLLGPLPQADTIEPWDPDDPEEPWELRCELPDLQAEDWVRLRDALQAAGQPGVLAVAPRPGERAAWDAGLLVADPLTGGVLQAVMAVDAERGEPRALELLPVGADAEMERAEQDLARALQAVDPSLRPISDRGPDTLQPVVHPHTGRLGLRLTLPSQVAEHLPEEPRLALRARVVEALAGVVAARAESPGLRLAPDLLWEGRLGLGFVLWVVAPASPPLPGDEAVLPGVDPGLAHRIPALDGLCTELEVQVVPATPADHDRVVEQVLPVAETAGWAGALPRWVRLGEAHAFAPTWRAPLEADPAALREVAHELVSRPTVAAVRVLPGEPSGLGEAWAQVEPAWHHAGRLVFLRCRDGLTDRDRLPRARERAPTPRDEALVAEVGAGPWRALLGAGDRQGVELDLGSPLSTGPQALQTRLDQVGRTAPPPVASLAFWGLRKGQVRLQLWWRLGSGPVG